MYLYAIEAFFFLLFSDATPKTIKLGQEFVKCDALCTENLLFTAIAQFRELAHAVIELRVRVFSWI